MHTCYLSLQVQRAVTQNAKSTRAGLFNTEDEKYINQRFLERWRMMHTDMHAAAYMLHPSFWDDEGALGELELVDGVTEVIKRLLPNQSDQVKALSQLTMFW